jgi:uncharacterized membrane protein
VTTGGIEANTGRWGMTWQLWVLVAAVFASGLLVVFVVRMRHAQQVFNRIVGQVDESRNDEIARHRRARGRLLRDLGQPAGVAAHARRHH